MKKSFVTLLFIFITCFTTTAFSEEVFMDVNFEETNEIYRIKTFDENTKPVGWIFSTELRVLGYYIDVICNHRFIYENMEPDGDFKPSSNFIYRQVFDGSLSEADKGRAGHQACFDSRDKIIPGENGKIIYRTPNVVFSAGNGKPVEESKAKEELLENECEIKENKNWYSIPNGSWYQSWYSSNVSSPSYDIFYDRWEEKQSVFFEELWRGDSLYKAFERPVGLVPTKRLLRAQIDGALEEVDGGNLKPVLEASYNKAFYMLPGRYNQESKIGCYCWYGNQKGTFSVDKAKVDITPIYESLEPEKRFVCYGTAITGLRKFYIMGTDILKQWLAKFAFPTQKAECTNVAFVSLEKTFKSMIFVYSEPEDCIYRFIINEENEVDIGLPKKIEMKFKVSAMAVSEQGTLYLIPELVIKPKPELSNLEDVDMESCLVLETNKEINLDSKEESEDSYNERAKMFNMLTCDAKCKIILSRPYYMYFYEIPFSTNSINKLNYELFLGKEYFSCDASFKNITLSKLNGRLETLLEESKKPGNSINPVEDKVPGYKNTFKKPQSIYLAIFDKD